MTISVSRKVESEDVVIEDAASAEIEELGAFPDDDIEQRIAGIQRTLFLNLPLVTPFGDRTKPRSQ